MITEVIEPRWRGEPCIVAATGPSLTEDAAEACIEAHGRGWRIVAVNDAYRRLPCADALYACDAAWWEVHRGCPDFRGERWSSHEVPVNEKRAAAEAYGLRLVAGANGRGFSLDPEVIHYANSSGFQAINLAVLWGASPIVLVGFDMHVKGGRHFFGDHPRPLGNRATFAEWTPLFDDAAAHLPPSIRIVNATPGSALGCWPYMELGEALALQPIRAADEPEQTGAGAVHPVHDRARGQVLSGDRVPMG